MRLNSVGIVISPVACQLQMKTFRQSVMLGCTDSAETVAVRASIVSVCSTGDAALAAALLWRSAQTAERPPLQSKACLCMAKNKWCHYSPECQIMSVRRSLGIKYHSNMLHFCFFSANKNCTHHNMHLKCVTRSIYSELLVFAVKD